MKYSRPLRILIAVPHPWLRETIAQLLTDSSVHISYANNYDALWSQIETAPEVVIIDPFGFDEPGLDLLNRLRQTIRSTPLIALIPWEGADYRDAVIRAGANVAIYKETADRHLAMSLAKVLKGKQFDQEINHLLTVSRNLPSSKEGNTMSHSNNEQPRYTLSRRTFLKGSAAAAGAAALTHYTPRVIYALEEAGSSASSAQAASSQEQVFNAVCAPNCWMGCRLKAHVRDGKLVKTSMNPFPEERYNRICLRGLSHVQRVYHKDRLKYPMKRAGKRGENKWERITWEEAISTIASEFSRVRDEYGSRAVMFAPMSGNYGIINGGTAGAIQRFASIFEGTVATGSIDMAMPLGLAQVMASFAGGFGGWLSGNEAADMANSRLILVWGSNITESQVHNWHFIADAIEDNGAKLVVIDPTFTSVAAKADIWVRPRPGSDPALILSILHTLIEEELYDKEFVLNHTVGPFLVRSDDGMFLREDPEDPTSRYMVWDEAVRKAVPFDEAEEPALFGSFKVERLDVSPAFQLLADEAAKHIPEEAVAYTEVPPEQVRELARLYATRTPAFIYTGFGIDRWDNGHLNGRGLATMAALTGNTGVSGATPAGTFGGGALFLAMDPAVIGPWLFPSGTYYSPLYYLLVYDAITKGEVNMFHLADPANPLAGTTTAEPVPTPYPIKAAFLNTSNFISNFPNQNKIEQELFSEDNLEFVVVADMIPTDTTAYADIILPVTHWFENDDVVGGIHPFLLIQEKALESPYECKSDFEIFQLLAEEMGYGEYFQGTSKDYVDEVVAQMAKVLGEAGAAAIDAFKEAGAVRLFPYPYVAFRDRQFMTPTGRMEFYAEKVIVNFPNTSPATGIPVSMGVNPLPHFEPPAEAWPENPLYEKYPLVNYQEHSRWRVHSQWFGVPWLRELDPEPVVKLNPEDAETRGLKTGDYAEVFNDRGHAVFKVIVTEGVRKGMVNTPKGWQRHQFKAGGYQELTADHKHPVHLNCSFFDTLVEVKKA